MLKKCIYSFVLLLGVTGLLLSVSGCDENSTAQDIDTATIRVQNLTVGQPFGPTLVIVHNAQYSLFENGQIASSGLEALAEDAITMTLEEDLADNENVFGTFVGSGPVAPLGSQALDIEFTSEFNQVTVAQMLVNTNDAFYAARNVTIPDSGSTLRRVPAYDAGTEPDDENCENVPGPACGGGRGAPSSPDGRVYISNGVFGEVGDVETDLDPSVYDWRNPVADITVSR